MNIRYQTPDYPNRASEPMNRQTDMEAPGYLGLPSMTTALISAALISLTIACGSGDLAEQHEREIKLAQQEKNDTTGNSGETDPDTDEPDTGAGEGTTADRLLQDYSLVFKDEFDGAMLDTAKWNTAYLWGPDYVINDELQYYVDILGNPDFGFDPFVLTGDTVEITARRTPQDMLSASNDQAWQSGVLTSRDKFDFTFGYAEIRAKLPTGKGLWSGFWMLPADFVELKPELYIMENRGDNTSAVYHRYNFTDNDGEYQISDLLKSTGTALNEEFHTYGVHWEPGRLRFFVDGEPQHTIEHDFISYQSMYLILDLAVGGWFAEAPNDSTVFPAALEIDYLRVYQQN